MRRATLLSAMLCFTVISGVAAQENLSPAAKRGQELFAACAACHTQASVPSPNPGPDLRGVVGRRAGSVPGFRYSSAMKRAKHVWTEETLDPFIADPQAALPGNTMPFPGLPDQEQRRDLIEFLKTLK